MDTTKYTAAAEEYMTRLKFRNLSPHTLTNYAKTLRLFGDFLEAFEGDDLYDAVMAWQAELMRSGRAPSTVNQYLCVLNIFFDKATKRSFPKDLRFSENPVDTSEAPKVVSRPYDELLTDEQVISLLKNEPPVGAKKSLWARNYAILMILLGTKIRNAELLDLRLCDIDFAESTLFVASGKGRKARLLDMDDLVANSIRQYLASGSRPEGLSPNDYLFGTFAEKERGGRRFGATWHRGSSQWLSDIVRRTVLAKVGTDNIRSHDLRHIGSRLSLNAGASMEQLQGELGHSSFSLIERYAGRLQARHKRASAREVLAARDVAAKDLETKLNSADAAHRKKWETA